jgi:hypothetical protein
MLLRGMGATLALPWLEMMEPLRAFGAPAPKAPPKRMAFVYVPNGMHMQELTPRTEGKDYEITSLLEPLKAFRDDLTVFTGLTCDKARPNGDGPGDHARAMASFLTGKQARKTNGSDIRVGISVDQMAAQTYGEQTRLPSLEIGCEGGKLVGNCDSGYSCAYSANLSWRSESTPCPKEVDPRQVFERLFGSGAAEAEKVRKKREQYRKSILDLVTEDADRLRGDLGGTDRQKLDEYLTAVREIEQRIERAEKMREAPPQAPTGSSKPLGVPQAYADHIRLLADMLVLAFQTDLTRICTFAFANEGSNRPYRFIDVPEGHHDLSHHESKKEKLDKIKKINLFHLTQFAYLLEKLKGVREGEGTLLDSCMIVYGSGNSDGNRHNHDNLPILLAGKGGGTIKAGRHIRVRRETPLANLYVSMLERLGIKVASFGDSTGALRGLEG